MTSRPPETIPEAVLFDLDDTLCDYAGARAARLRIAFSLGLDAQASGSGDFDLDQMIEESIRMHPHGADHFGELFWRYGIDDPASAILAADWYTANRFHGLQLFPETIDVLRAMRTAPDTRGRTTMRPIGVVTNGPTEVQRAKAALLNIVDLADFVLISEEFGVAKPAPEIFREALRRTGVSAENAVFVGDSVEFDVLGAQATGMRPVWLNRRGEDWGRNLPRPWREIRSLHELPALFGLRL